MKAKAKEGTSTNIKPMAGGGAIATLTGGQYVFGDLSSQATDIINFSHYYTATGVRIELGKPCKVYIGSNLIVTNETESTTPTDPESTNDAIVKAVIYFEDGTTQELFP